MPSDRVERQLSDFESRMAIAMETTNTTFWELNYTSQQYYVIKADKGHCTNIVSPWLGEETLRLFMHPDDVQMAYKGLQDVAEIGGQVMEMRCRVAKHALQASRYLQSDVPKEWEWMLFSGRRVDASSLGANDNHVVVAGSMQNIAQLQQAEDSLTELTHDLEKRVSERTAELNRSYQEVADSILELQQAQDQLVESKKMAALGSMVAGVAHEVNTPLGICVTALSHIKTVVDQLEQKYKQNKLSRTDLEHLFSETQDGVSLTLSNVERASNLIKSFKQVSVEQSNEDAHEFELVELIKDSIDTVRPRFKNSVHQVKFDGQLPINMCSHAGAISQIIINFMINSLTHGFDNEKPGEMEILVSEVGDDEVLLIYRDNGKGIKAENLFKIFDPFFTTNRQQGNTGLGMNITYNLVNQKLKGQIIVNSLVDQGAEFYIRIPKRLDKLKKK
ncbi:hypothetical protein C2869_10830 [Saccharobesus litoralis]|uniref:histidine kinase n=1 Tax=Saccharobesus litoralis TaxID=2172099 RepID=A0A2S0VRR2_9ALTE|nr:ATP-binding protein [Saccharobesus litoralis]AWB66897.1 hypothetical protein C2869_10830 [Saccharobesus litoralis]